jgi:hypothetical protein
MERIKLTPNVTLNTLESMIEYTLMLNILDRICEMTKSLNGQHGDGLMQR